MPPSKPLWPEHVGAWDDDDWNMGLQHERSDRDLTDRRHEHSAASRDKPVVSFYYDGTNWVETNRAAADI